VAMVAQHFAAFREGEGERGFEGVENIAPAGVGEDLIGIGGAVSIELGNGFGSQGWHRAMELVFQFSVGVDEADFFPFMRKVKGGEAPRLPLAGSVPRGPNGGGGTVTEEAEADENAGIVVGEEGGGANFDSDGGDGGVRVGRQKTVGGAQGGDGGAAAEPDEIGETGIRPQAELFGDMAGDSGAEVAGAGAEKEGVDGRRRE